MKNMKYFLSLLILVFINITCQSQSSKKVEKKIVYNTKDLIITQLTKNIYMHTSFLQTESFGNVPCNGLIVNNKNEALIYDTTTDNKSSDELINWIENNLHSKIKAVIATHFHEDNLGGLKAFNVKKIPTYAYFKTVELAKEQNLELPKNSFKNHLLIKVGNLNTSTKFFGEGHTRDNVIGYIEKENVLFGGCLIKEIDANKGYLGDSNTKDWSATVEKIKQAYPNVKIIVPGHGEVGDKKLLDYTIQLFKN
jgi:metallo-beta-lactamase class B